MKAILILLFLNFLLFANQKQIVLSSYSNTKNANTAKNSVNHYINKDKKLKKIFTKYSLKVKYKKHGKYFRVVVEPFNSSNVLKLVVKKLRIKFKDAYILNIAEKKAVKQIRKKPIHKKVVKQIRKKTIQKKVIKPIQKKPIQKKKIVSKKQNVKHKTEEKIIINNKILTDEPDISQIKVSKTVSKENIGIKPTTTIDNQYIYLIIIIFIVFMIAIYFLSKKSKYKNSDNNNKEILNENFQENNDVFERMIQKNNDRRESKQKDIYSEENQTNSNKKEIEDASMIMEERPEAINFDTLPDTDNSKTN